MKHWKFILKNPAHSFFLNKFHNFYPKLCVICFQISLIIQKKYIEDLIIVYFFTHLHSDRQKGDSLTDPVG